MATKVDDISATLLRLVMPEISYKELLRAVRAEHPKASKKDIVHAACALITSADGNPTKAKKLHGFALRERVNAAAEASGSR